MNFLKIFKELTKYLLFQNRESYSCCLVFMHHWFTAEHINLEIVVITAAIKLFHPQYVND